MPRRFEQLLEKKHPEYVSPSENIGNRTNVLIEGVWDGVKKAAGAGRNALGDAARGLKNTQKNLSDLNKSADDGLFGVMTHGVKDDTGDEEKIKKSWDALGEFAKEEWEKKAVDVKDDDGKPKFTGGLNDLIGVEGYTSPGFQYFREIQIEKFKRYADPTKPRTRQEMPDDSNSVDFDDYIESEWNAMDDGDKQRYTDFDEYLEMRKRTEQQRGGQS